MLKKILSRIFIWLVLTILYLPLMLLVVFSFSTTRAIKLNDFKFGIDLYRKLFENDYIWSAVGNTLIIAFLSALIATIMGTVACVGILAMRNRRKNAIMTLNQIPIINADIVTAFALMLFFVALGITNAGYMKLVLAHTLICVPFVVLTILPRLRQLDSNLFEAGQDLGATPTQALFQIIIPQLIPAMLSGFLLSFTLSLDDFVITQYNNDGIHTISTVVYQATKRGVPPEFRALSTIMFLMVVAVLVVVNIKSKKKGGRKK